MISRGKIEEAARHVRSGGVIVYPTATVYGLGGDPTRPEVVARIRQIKGRPDDKPMLLLADRWERVEHWITRISSAQERLMAAVPPLPVTILFETRASDLSAVRGNSHAIGIRCTGDPLCRRLIEEVGHALISTSANRAGAPPPHHFDDIDPDLLSGVDAAIDAGHPLRGEPSTVVAFEDDELQIVRQGAVSEAELLEVISGTL